eukprot:TRINITY_DN55250_c0_g1_i1.p1 TRINITY_DN55250_c0_g1~~TRINITY_DN55250_c0_g1_i1.p1  ORF type:complete len:208 (+),score=24.95 TRINITY_DN55250_c0_g1_i1:95-718(+)
MALGLLGFCQTDAPLGFCGDADQRFTTALDSGRDALGGCSARTTDSNPHLSERTQQEKEMERLRLERLVRDFTAEALAGIEIECVDSDTADKAVCFLQVDTGLRVLSIKPEQSRTMGEKEVVSARSLELCRAVVRDISLSDIRAIYRGQEILMVAPALAQIAQNCVGLDTGRADRWCFFYFHDPVERDRFYTCLKVLRLSTEARPPI